MGKNRNKSKITRNRDRNRARFRQKATNKESDNPNILKLMDVEGRRMRLKTGQRNRQDRYADRKKAGGGLREKKKL